MADRLATDTDIRQQAERLYAHASTIRPRLFDRQWWSGRLLEWAIRDEAFKVRLFQFIDVLPTLTTPAQVTRLVEEYFHEAGGPDYLLQFVTATVISEHTLQRGFSPDHS